jgi:porin
MIWFSRAAIALLLFAAPDLARAEDPPGFLDRLIKAGVTPSLVIDNEAVADLAGGAKRGATFSSALHAQLSLDGERLLGLPGVTGWFDVLWINGGQPDALVGDAQGISSIGAPPVLRLYEAWLQYTTPGNRLSILAGRYDLNTEFYHLNSASLFLNSSFGIGVEFGHSAFAGPSVFPNTSLGVRFAYQPVANAELRFAILDGAPVDPQPGSHGAFNSRNGLLLVAEGAYVTHAPDKTAANEFHIGRVSSASAYDDKIAVGAWYYTANFDDLSAVSSAGTPVRRQGQGGAYLLADHLLYQSDSDPKRRLTGFVQLGIANQQVDRFGSYVGAGLAVSGLSKGRPDDQLGVALAMARNGSHYIESQQEAGLPVTAAETAIELSYLAQIASWVSLEPDLQYVFHPNTDPRRRDAVVGQLRVEIKF